MPLPPIQPGLVNSASPWATNIDDLQALFDCKYTGAVTTRTSMLVGFEHDSNVHRYVFFSPEGHSSKGSDTQNDHVSNFFGGSLNTLGYSPYPLDDYLAMISLVVSRSTLAGVDRDSKPFIISVTGSAEDVLESYRKIKAVQQTIMNPLCMEINLSCPNIPNKPPPAYSEASLVEYLQALASERAPQESKPVAVGIKTPPYTYYDQFRSLIDALKTSHAIGCPVDFITATNTLGSCLVFDEDCHYPRLISSPTRNEDGTYPPLDSLSATGVGGMGGTPLHPLSLGNVRTIRRMLNQHAELANIEIVGVGGVSDKSAGNRMRAAGAAVVGVGTALGREGVGIFEKIGA